MLDPMRANMRRAALVLLAGFFVVALALGYWQIVRAQDLGVSPSNPRVAQDLKDQPRGRILDRNGVVLADSTTTAAGTVRHYADPSLVHVIGFHSTRFGDTDLEAAYDGALRGEQSPNPMDRLVSSLFHTPPVTSDLVLTIDRQIQDAAVQALGDNPGAIVALDPHTGAVLAMVSYPYFDPNAGDDALAKLQTDPSQPLFNRAIASRYVSGSVFKAVTGSAAVDLGLVNLDQKFHCTTAVNIGTYSVNCNNSLTFPYLTYKQAFAWSSNRVFALSGMLLGFPGPMNPWLDDNPPGPYPWTQPGASISASAAHLEDYATRYGFTRQVPFDLPITPSQIKDPATPWTAELLAQTAFGQGQILVTPMQMALVTAGIANDGKVPAPYVVSEIRAGGASEQPHQPGTVFSQATSSATAQAMNSFMVEGTVSGYAEPAAIAGVKVGGKTGTAEVGDGTSHAWFIGFAPADNPIVAVAVIMEHKGSGTTFATPAGRDVMQEALKVYKR